MKPIRPQSKLFKYLACLSLMSSLLLVMMLSQAHTAQAQFQLASQPFLRWFFDIRVGGHDLIVEETIEIWEYDHNTGQSYFLVSQTFPLPPCILHEDPYDPIIFSGDAAFFNGNNYVECQTVDLYERALQLSIDEGLAPLFICRDMNGNPLPPPCWISAKGVAVEADLEIPDYVWNQYPINQNAIYSYQHIYFSAPMWSYPFYNGLFFLDTQIEVGGKPPAAMMMIFEEGYPLSISQQHYYTIAQECMSQCPDHPFVFRMDGQDMGQVSGEPLYYYFTAPEPLFIGFNPTNPGEKMMGWYRGGRIDPTAVCAICPS